MADIEILTQPPEDELIQEPSVDIFNSEENMRACVNYLAREVEEVSTDSGRTTRMERNDIIKRQRLGRPESETKDFPWENASNVSPPLALQKTNKVVSKLVSSYLEKVPFFKYESHEPYKEHAKAVTAHVQDLMESPYGIDLYNKLWDILYETASLGTAFVKVPFTVDSMRFMRASESGTELIERIIKASPEVYLVPFEDFMTRPEWDNIQRAPWIGVRYYKYRWELEQLFRQGYYSNVDLIINEESGFNAHKKLQDEYMGVTSSSATADTNNIYEIYECNVRWDADGDGFAEDIIVHFEKNTQTILRAEYNELGIRDYVRIPYINIPGSLYGLGVGDIMISLQDEIETLHNMRNDATQLSILPLTVTSELADMGKDEKIYPGKNIKTPVPREDINIIKFPDVGPSALQAEQYVNALADDATGASQALNGQDIGGYNRIGATGTQFLAGQSLSFLDSIAGQTAKAFERIGELILYQLVRNSNFVVDGMEGLDQKVRMLATEVYAMNVEDIPTKFKFKARLSTLVDSKGSKQQQAMTLFQLYMAYGDKLSSVAAQLSNPQLAQAPKLLEVMQTYYVGLTNLMETILKAYDEDAVQDYLPFIRDMELQLQVLDTQREQEVKSFESVQAGRENQEIQNQVSPDTGIGAGGINSPEVASPGGPTSTGETLGGAAPTEL